MLPASNTICRASQYHGSIKGPRITYNSISIHYRLQSMGDYEKRDVFREFLPERGLDDCIRLVVYGTGSVTPCGIFMYVYC